MVNISRTIKYLILLTYLAMTNVLYAAESTVIASTFFGGAGNENIKAILPLDDGDMLVAGEITSSLTMNGVIKSYTNQPGSGSKDLYILRLSKDLKKVVASTYLGNAKDNEFQGLTLNSKNRNLYVLVKCGCDSDIVYRLPLDLSSVFRTNVNPHPGTYTNFFSITSTSDGKLFLAGLTRDTSFPLSNGSIKESLTVTSPNATTSTEWLNTDGLIVRLSENLELERSTYFGGAAYDQINAIASDNRDRIVIAGWSNSQEMFSDKKRDLQAADSFLAVLDKDFSSADIRFFGGDGTEEADGLFIDSNYAYVTGRSTSTIFNNLNSGFHGSAARPVDTFVVRFDINRKDIGNYSFLNTPVPTTQGYIPGRYGAQLIAVNDDKELLIASTISSSFNTSNLNQSIPDGVEGSDYANYIARFSSDLGDLKQAILFDAEKADQAGALAYFGGKLLVGSNTFSSLSIAAPTGYQSLPGGAEDSYLMSIVGRIVADDNLPDEFNFKQIREVAPSTMVKSETVVVAGISSSVLLSVKDGEYSIGCNGVFTTNPSSILAGETFCLRHNSGDFSAVKVTEVSVGDYTQKFTTVAISKDTTPDPLPAQTRSSVPAGVLVTFPEITITGINAPSKVTITGGEYSIGGCTSEAVFVSTPSYAHVNDRICVRNRSAKSVSTLTTILNVGGVDYQFESTTTNVGQAGGGGGGGAFGVELVVLLLAALPLLRCIKTDKEN